ncbi:MAG: lipoyl(octanoyl) transferase LipB [Thermoleophilia bacterium]
MSAALPHTPPRIREPLSVFDLGTVPYLPTQALQAQLRAQVAEGALRGVLLLLEHEPVITLGSRGSGDDVVSPALVDDRGISVLPSERGGAATLHAPGQLVSYPIMPIPHRDLRAYVRSLEQVLINLLATVGVDAGRRQGAPGLYVRESKIASVGLRCQRWVASHGTSLNVSVDLTLFDAIVSCGEADLRQTSVLQEIGVAPPMERIKDLYSEAFAEVFGVRVLQAESVGLGELRTRSATR